MTRLEGMYGRARGEARGRRKREGGRKEEDEDMSEGKTY